jgi:hypothetical protein
MISTDVNMRINMGIIGGLSDHALGIDEAQTHFEELKSHISDILPTLDDLDNLDDAARIKEVSLKTLEIGCFAGGLYNIQFTMTIQHDVPVRPKSIREITEIVFEHGANSPITFDEFPNYFLYPYESSRIVDDEEVVTSQDECDSDNESDNESDSSL